MENDASSTRANLEYANARRKSPSIIGRMAIYAFIGFGLGVALFVTSLGAKQRYHIWWIGPILFPWTSMTIVIPMLDRDPYSEAIAMLIWIMGPIEYAVYGMIYAVMRCLMRRLTIIAGLIALHAAAAGTVVILVLLKA